MTLPIAHWRFYIEGGTYSIKLLHFVKFINWVSPVVAFVRLMHHLKATVTFQSNIESNVAQVL